MASVIDASLEETLSYIAGQLKTLTSIASPTGYTRAATDYLMETLRDMGFGPERSNKGNVLVELGGEGEPLVLASHVDTLGAMVRSIKDNGRLRPTTLGGHQWSTADGENCTVYTRDGNVYTGVVLNTEPSAHVADEPVKTIEKNMEILLDENVDSKDDVLELGIQTGDIIAMDPRTTVTESDLGCTERMVSICAKDSGGPYNYDLVTTLSNIARELELDYAIDVYPHYGSDVEATLSAGYDIRHGLIGPGVYASHNYERSHIDGVRNTYELVRAYVQR